MIVLHRSCLVFVTSCIESKRTPYLTESKSVFVFPAVMDTGYRPSVDSLDLDTESVLYTLVCLAMANVHSSPNDSQGHHHLCGSW